MIIKKIRLQNITTHVDTTIDFYNGVNILMGKNGTGKSTVLTMIGYVLFNHLPGKSQDLYVRNSTEQKWGMITLWFIGNDSKAYCIKRAIGKANNKIEVYLGDEETRLQKISTVNNLVEFLKSVVGVHNFGLQTIFENAIGVQQGMFTAPFLLPPARRKNVFSPLLKVEVYDLIWKQFRKINTEFEQRINQKLITISSIEGKLDNKDQVQADLQELEVRLVADHKKLDQQIHLLAEIENQYSQLKQIKDSLEKTQNLHEQHTLQLNTKRQTIENLESNISEASKAQAICQRTQADFEAFNKYTQLQSEYQAQNEQRIRLEKRMIQLSEQIQVNRAKLEDISKNLAEITRLEDQYRELTTKYRQYKELADTITKYQEKKTKILTQEEELEKKKTENIPLKEQMKEIQKELLILPQMETEVAQLEKFNKELLIFSKKIATVETRIQDLEENVANVKNGICPLCKQAYHEPGKTLDESFREEIRASRQSLIQFQTESASIEQTITRLKQKDAHLTLLRDKQIRFKELSRQLGDNRRRIKELSDLVSHKEDIINLLKESLKQKVALEDQVSQYHILHNKFTKELPQYQKSQTQLQKTVSDLKTQLEPLQKAFLAYERLPETMKQNQQLIDKCRANHDLYQTNRVLSSKLLQYRKDLEQERKQLSELATLVKSELQQIETLQEKFDPAQYSNLEDRLTAVTKAKNVLEGEISQKQLTFTKLEATFRQLETLAKDLTQQTTKLHKLESIHHFSQTIRNWFKESEPKITAALMHEINETGSDLYRQIKDETAVRLEWQNDYDVYVYTAQFPPRSFNQLSGGEQMAVALSLRLAILKVLTSIDFAFFDEPTTNLDEAKRTNLAQCIERIKGFKQLFIISHDDTFEENSDHVIRFDKDEDEISRVDFIGQSLF